ncbi:MAG TPA: ABC transporter permease, partial [Acidimicrobiales bacterium]|nr:ABC transporter permease [Acidimicrobiales bacterium]
RLLFTILIMVAVGYAVGFRFQAGFVDAIWMILLATYLGLAVCLVSALIGLVVRDEESVQAFGLIWVFPLTFVSSAFVQVSNMPTWLRGFANNQPFTQVIDALRFLSLGHQVQFLVHESAGSAIWQSLAWITGVIVVFIPLATRAYEKV